MMIPMSEIEIPLTGISRSMWEKSFELSKRRRARRYKIHMRYHAAAFLIRNRVGMVWENRRVR